MNQFTDYPFACMGKKWTNLRPKMEEKKSIFSNSWWAWNYYTCIASNYTIIHICIYTWNICACVYGGIGFTWRNKVALRGASFT